ncbi:MAG: hypothetical protein OXR68_04015 [Alphaproteobacteria bacterium]|nr:hypothetical protein [Alphaproteobacteria bacterium]MDD9919772.1 hypothetical protein [Alphaproteobacteria bacterium]
MKPIEIFRAGTHTAMSGNSITITSDELQQAIESYNPETHEAPLTVGHPKHDEPAYGWVDRLEMGENGTLLAHPKQVDADFADMVNAGKFKKVSASFYLPNSSSNPTPGKLQIRHVGFLGAQPPAVKGLKNASFSDDQGEFETFEFSEIKPDTSFLNKLTSTIEAAFTEAAKKFNPEINQNKEDAMTGTNNQEQEQKLAAEREALEKEKAAFAEKQRVQNKKESEALLDKAVNEGRISGEEKAGLAAFMETLDDEESNVCFGEGKEATENTPLGFFREFISKLPTKVEFAEIAKNEGTGSQGVASFAAPNGYQVDPERLELLKKAEAYAAKHNTSLDEALNKVEGL